MVHGGLAIPSPSSPLIRHSATQPPHEESAKKRRVSRKYRDLAAVQRLPFCVLTLRVTLVNPRRVVLFRLAIVIFLSVSAFTLIAVSVHVHGGVLNL